MIRASISRSRRWVSLNSHPRAFLRFAAFALLALGVGFTFAGRPIPYRGIRFTQKGVRHPAARARFSFASPRQGGSRAQNLSWEFEPNVGQAVPQAKFIARANDASVFLTQSGLAVVWTSRAARSGKSAVSPRQTALQMEFEGAQKSAQLSATGLLPGKTNYLLGNDPRQWHTNVPHYSAVQYRSLYPQVDARFYGNLHGLEYDLIVQPGGDLRNARLSLRGASALTMNRAGDVLVRVGSRQIAMHRPQIYQQDGVRRINVVGGYKLLSRDEIGFAVGEYRADLPLVIDPQISIVYTTFLGGNGADKANSVVTGIDSSGNTDVYVGGTTTTVSSWPETPTLTMVPASATSNLFAAKIQINAGSPETSQLVYLTFFGGSGNDQGGMIALDNSASPPNLAVLGWTTSTDFPVTVTSGNPGSSLDGSSDMTVTDLNGAGNALNYSEYYGGSGAEATQGYAGIATDASGDVYMTSDTTSTDLMTTFPPATAGFQSLFEGTGTAATPPNNDGFLAEFNTSGSLLYATYFGIDATVGSTSVALDASGNAYVVGFTSSSSGFPTTNGFSGGPGGGDDAFVMQIRPTSSGGIVYASTFGGSGSDQAFAIALDTSSPPDAYITGTTQSSDFIPSSGVTNAGYQTSLNGASNAFLAVVSQTSATPTVSSLQYETYLGGTGSDSGQGIAVVSPSQVYVVGKTTSNNFPVLCSLQSFTGTQDAFLAELNPTASGASSLIYTSFLAGSASTEANAVATDSSGDAIVAGDTTSNDYPLVTGAPQTGIQPICTSCASSPAQSDAFLTTVTLPSGPSACGAYSPSVWNFGSFAEDTASPPMNFQFTNDGDAAMNITQFQVTGPNEQDFTASSPPSTNSCLAASLSLIPGANCDFQVIFTPSTVGLETAEVQITDGGVGSPQTLQLTGMGASQEISLMPNSLSFPPTPEGQIDPNAMTATLMNTGNESLSISSAQISGMYATDFTFATGNTCTTSATISPGSTCTVAITFAPNESGPPLTLNAQDVITTVGVTTNTTETVSIALSGQEVAAAPGAVFSPTSLTFTNENVGVASGSQPITLTNNGNISLSISSIAITGANPGDFSLSPASNCPILPSTLSPNSPNNSCTINVLFKPTTTGLRSASVTVTDNAGGSPQSVPLSGTGTSPGVNFSLPNLTFGPQDVSTSSTPPMTVMLSNTGNGPLTISSIGFTGTNPGDFSQTNNCPSSSSTLNQNSACTISVTFTPTATGSRSALLTVTDDATTSPQTLPVSGTGAQPTALFVPNGLQFPTTVVGIKVSGTPVQVQNTGNGPLVITNLSFAGADPGDFSATGTCVPSGSNVTVAAGGNCSLTLSFLPTSSGARSANLVLTDNAPNSPQTDVLNGTAQDYQLQPISGGSTSATIAAGSSATISMQVTPFNGFSGTVNLSCSDSVTGSTCSITPSVAVSGNSPAPFTVNLTTTASSSGSTFLRSPFGNRPFGLRPLPLWTLWLLAFALLAFLLKAKPRRRYLRPLLVLSVLALSSCGGGNGSTTTQSMATPPGSYTIVVTGTITGTSRSANLTLTVTQ